jgi:hypothetical protein
MPLASLTHALSRVAPFVLPRRALARDVPLASLPPCWIGMRPTVTAHAITLVETERRASVADSGLEGS